MIDFTVGAIASGVTYDVLKKVAVALREKFGAAKVSEVDKKADEAAEVPDNQPADDDGEQ
ncbi:hypothetical protein [Aminobacter sp. MSH1]|uniref:hypothetical protein n=1 Tax=Aminobacter sp. MSH1 TaxID=374606 RepID=UPI000D367AA7|nr:hypothetical protein [Aminobacter sp. MSH1]